MTWKPRDIDVVESDLEIAQIELGAVLQKLANLTAEYEAALDVLRARRDAAHVKTDKA
jgi:hypothetical protein